MAGGLQMKNHYVSQLIIKRFSNPINIFDIEKEQIAANKKFFFMGSSPFQT